MIRASLLETPIRATNESETSAPEHLIALAEVGRHLTSGGDIPDAVARALRVLDRRLAALRSVLSIADPERRTLEIEATHGLATEQFRMRFGQGVAGRVSETGRPIVVPVLRHEPMALSELSDLAAWSDGHWSVVSVPVTMAGRHVGALSAYFPRVSGDDFSGRLGVLEIAASLIGKPCERRASRA